MHLKFSLKELFFTSLLFLYLLFALFINETGFILLGLLFLFLSVVFFISLDSKKIVRLSPIINYFFFAYTIFVLSAQFFWSSYDLKDIVAIYVFFVFLPLLFINITFLHQAFLTAIYNALYFFFVISSVFIIFYGLKYGIDWGRPNFYEGFLFHKNGIATIYELLLIFVIYDIKRTKILKFLIVSVIGVCCLIIVGSKTALLVFFLFTLGRFSKYAFVIFLIGYIVSLTVIMSNNDNIEDSAFRTANYRVLIWNQAMNEIFNFPEALIGNGPGAFQSKVEKYGLQDVDNTHNYLIQLTHSYGFIGLVIFLTYFFAVLIKFGFWSSPFTVAFWAFNIHSLFDVGWVKGPGFFVCVIMGGIFCERIVYGHFRKDNSKKIEFL